MATYTAVAEAASIANKRLDLLRRVLLKKAARTTGTKTIVVVKSSGKIKARAKKR
jgi:hypothetical protein